jgi:piRNA pathway germ-plasm component
MIQTEQTKIFSELQVRWKCEYHTQDKDVYCWKSADNGVCYALSTGNLGFWAIEIVLPFTHLTKHS